MTTSSKRPSGQTARRERTRNALVSAALGLLEEGRNSATIEEITRRAGVGFGSFHNHFSSREELFTEAVLVVLDRYAEVLQTATADLSDPAERFAASFRLVGRLTRQEPDLLAPLSTIGTDALLIERGLRVVALADLRDGVSSGRFADVEPETLLVAVGGTLLGLVRLLQHEPERDAESTTDQITERVLCMLGIGADEARLLVSQPLPSTPQ